MLTSAARALLSPLRAAAAWASGVGGGAASSSPAARSAINRTTLPDGRRALFMFCCPTCPRPFLDLSWNLPAGAPSSCSARRPSLLWTATPRPRRSWRRGCCPPLRRPSPAASPSRATPLAEPSRSRLGAVSPAGGSFSDLRRALEEWRPHLFWFAGHGDTRLVDGDSTIGFSAPDGALQLVSPAVIAAALRQHRADARRATSEPFLGTFSEPSLQAARAAARRRPRVRRAQRLLLRLRRRIARRE